MADIVSKPSTNLYRDNWEAIFGEKKNWEQRARGEECAVEVPEGMPDEFCREHGHVRSLAYNGPRFVCLVCRRMLDRDPSSDAIFIKSGG